MWKGAACPLVADLLPHVIHDFLGKIFPVGDEVVKVGRIGVIVGHFHTLEVFEPHSIPNISSDDAPDVDSSRSPITRGSGGLAPDFHVFRRPRLRLSHIRTLHSPYSRPRVPQPWIFRSSTCTVWASR